MGKHLTKAELEAKQSWLNKFAEQRGDLLYPETWSPTEVAEADAMLTSDNIKANMFKNMVMICRGRKCQVAHSCPLLAKGKAPEGKPCPLETRLVQELTASIMDTLNIPEDDLVEVAMVKDLVLMEIMQMRAVQVLAYEDFIQETVVGFNERTGEPVFKKDLHAAVTIQDRILKNKKSIRQDLIADRGSKAKLGLGLVDQASRVAQAINDLREIDLRNKEIIERKLHALPPIDVEVKTDGDGDS